MTTADSRQLVQVATLLGSLQPQLLLLPVEGGKNVTIRSPPATPRLRGSVRVSAATVNFTVWTRKNMVWHSKDHWTYPWLLHIQLLYKKFLHA